jgi:hypothetical protein
MTLKEAKKILEKEGFKLDGPGKPHAVSGHFTEFEPLYIYEAMQVVSSAGYNIMMPVEAFDARKARLKKELKEHSNAPVSGKEKEKKGNPALKEAASQFNDALLDEQGKKIKRLTKKIARLNKIIHKKNIKIEEFRKESSRHLRGKIKMFGENMDLSQELCDKNEELCLTKIREKNLAELGLKYVGENEKLKKKLAAKIVDKIDAQALKSAESALAYKEKVIAEKDEVIADLGKELAAQKDLVDDISLKYDGAKHNLKLRMDECEKLKKQLESNTKMVQKMAEIIVHKKPVTVDVFKKCWIMAYSEEKTF